MNSPPSALAAAATRSAASQQPAPARLRRTVRLGLKSLWLHRLRSLLTVLGIVFGVCSVIAMLAIGEGASYEAQEQIKNLGSQNIILRSVKPPEEQKVSDKGSQSYVLQYGLTYTDVKRIRATIPGVTVVVPGRIIRDYVWNISRRVDCEIVGTVPWYPEMRNHRVARGPVLHRRTTWRPAPASACSARRWSPALFPLESPLGQRRPRGRRLLPGDRRHGAARRRARKPTTAQARRQSRRAPGCSSRWKPPRRATARC